MYLKYNLWCSHTGVALRGAAHQVLKTINQLTDDLAAMRRMTDSSSVNLRLASDSAAVRRDNCDLQSASTCMVTYTAHVKQCMTARYSHQQQKLTYGAQHASQSMAKTVW